jgi:hypothetical protein
LIATTSEATLESSYNGKGEENYWSCVENSINHPQTFGEWLADEELKMPDAGYITQNL